MVLLDFSRAYDRVWKNALYTKLRDLEIPICAIKWVRSFLSDRRARVKWHKPLSRERIFREGLPQGSILAPLLWLCYVKDAPEVDCNLFADDTSLCATTTSIKQCGLHLQPALIVVESWCRRWKVELSAGKSQLTTFTLDPKESGGKSIPNLKIGGEQLQYGKHPTFLGVTLDGQLRFSKHADVVAKTMSFRRNGLRALSNRSTGASIRALKAAYVSTVREAGD